MQLQNLLHDISCLQHQRHRLPAGQWCSFVPFFFVITIIRIPFFLCIKQNNRHLSLSSFLFPPLCLCLSHSLSFCFPLSVSPSLSLSLICAHANTIMCIGPSVLAENIDNSHNPMWQILNQPPLLASYNMELSLGTFFPLAVSELPGSSYFSPFIIFKNCASLSLLQDSWS